MLDTYNTRHFDNAREFGAMLGVSEAAVYAWMSGRRKPCAATIRLLEVLQHIEQMPLHAALVEQAKRQAAPPVEPKPALPVLTPGLLALKRESPLIASYKQEPRPKSTREWPDSYWFDRTITREEWDAGEWPAVEDGSAVLNAMSEEREGRYWASLKAYETRTGRVKPD